MKLSPHPTMRLFSSISRQTLRRSVWFTSIVLLSRLTKGQITLSEKIPVSCPAQSATGLEQHLQNTALFRKQFPKWTVQVANARCNMTKGSSTAEVWLSCHGVHTPGSQMFNRETVHVLYWRRSKTQGNWTCYRHQGLGGGGDFF